MMAFTGNSTCMPFSGFRCMKRYEHHQLKYMKDYGNLSFWSAKRAKRVLMVLWFIHISKTVHLQQ